MWVDGKKTTGKPGGTYALKPLHGHLCSTLACWFGRRQRPQKQLCPQTAQRVTCYTFKSMCVCVGGTMKLGLIILSDNLVLMPFCSPLLPSASLLFCVNVHVCGFVKWLSVFWVKLVAERLTWLLNGCYLWEGEADSANIVHSHFASLPLFFPFSPPPHHHPLAAGGNSCDDRENQEKRNSRDARNLGREQAGRKNCWDVRCRETERGEKGVRGIIRRLY